MYVSSTAPIPQHSMSPMNPATRARYNRRKQRIFLAVASAASRYDCASAPATFDGFGANFLYQVDRARALLNQVGTLLSSEFPAGLITPLPAGAVQKSITSTGTSGAPAVVSWSPATTNPAPADPAQPANFAGPHWGDAATQDAQVPVPATAAARHPWLTVGAIAALALAAGILNGGGGGGFGGRA